MARACTVCHHSKRDAIDLALATDATTITAAAHAYDLSYTSVWRHRSRHLPLALVKARAANDIANADRLVAAVEEIRVTARRLAERASERGDDLSVLRSIDRQLAALGLLAKMGGAPDVTVSITLSDEWVRLRDRLVGALAPFPEARQAAVLALKAAA